MSNIIFELERSVSITKKWGAFKLPNGKTLNEHFTLNDMPFWEIMSPYIALYEVPQVLSNSATKTTALNYFRPNIALAKRNVLNRIKTIKVRRNFNNTWPEDSVFLFLGFSGYMYRDVLAPVAEYLINEKGGSCLMLHDGSENQSITSSKINSQSIWKYRDNEIEVEIKYLQKQIKKAVREFQEMNIYHEMINDDDFTLWPKIKNAFNWLFSFHFPLMAPQVVIARHLLKRYPVSLIFSPDLPDPRVRVYALLSRQLNIPLFEVQFGPNGDEGVEWRFNIADRIATWGKNTHQKLLKHGVNSDIISITGTPRHDYMAKKVSNLEILEMRKLLGIPESVTMILCASTYQQIEYDSLSDPGLLTSMKKAVFEAADQIEGLVLVVKPHPLENVDETKKIIGNFKNIVVVDSKMDIRLLIKTCDAFVGFGTTATVDSLIAKKLTICPSFPGWIWSDLFVESNATIVPRTPGEIVSAFRKVANGSSEAEIIKLEFARNKFLEDLAFKCDGSASERIGLIAMGLINKNYCAP
jgi:hypothetical protein